MRKQGYQLTFRRRGLGHELLQFLPNGVSLEFGTVYEVPVDQEGEQRQAGRFLAMQQAKGVEVGAEV